MRGVLRAQIEIGRARSVKAHDGLPFGHEGFAQAQAGERTATDAHRRLMEGARARLPALRVLDMNDECEHDLWRYECWHRPALPAVDTHARFFAWFLHGGAESALLGV